jgi:hypothetical protein
MNKNEKRVSRFATRATTAEDADFEARLDDRIHYDDQPNELYEPRASANAVLVFVEHKVGQMTGKPRCRALSCEQLILSAVLTR